MNWAIFVSGNGTNLQNVLDHQEEYPSQQISVVVADRRCKACERAEKAKRPLLVISPKNDRFVSSVLDFLKDNEIGAIFLLGYMRILGADFLGAWNGPLINLHPSWLPRYPGTNAIEQAYANQDPWLGVTLHEVIEAVDAGPLVRQLSFPRDPQLSLDELTERVHEFERKVVRDYLVDCDSKERALEASRSV